ncbi:hypothetical protein GJ744_003393 [Endocarpon pusillum]|uniref:Uncharacterized protein n=1 Tax=Endocarpon pusillum TaxID=364733 RepID=A0A8H7DY70_9EURO|nr:hypothetical protein GJ744_003393 [Endocarpon pusillum]
MTQSESPSSLRSGLFTCDAILPKATIHTKIDQFCPTSVRIQILKNKHINLPSPYIFLSLTCHFYPSLTFAKSLFHLDLHQIVPSTKMSSESPYTYHPLPSSKDESSLIDHSSVNKPSPKPSHAIIQWLMTLILIIGSCIIIFGKPQPFCVGDRFPVFHASFMTGQTLWSLVVLFDNWQSYVARKDGNQARADTVQEWKAPVVYLVSFIMSILGSFGSRPRCSLPAEPSQAPPA